MKIKYIIGPAAELVAVSIGFINFKSFDKKLLFIFCFACFGFCIDLGTNILVEVFGLRHTLIFLHFYIPIEFLLISSAYYLALKDFLQKRIILYHTNYMSR